MKLAHTVLTAATVAAAAFLVAPASATFHPEGPKDPPTSVPEPSDAILLLMGAAGVVVGRKLHARAQRKG